MKEKTTVSISIDEAKAILTPLIEHLINTQEETLTKAILKLEWNQVKTFETFDESHISYLQCEVNEYTFDFLKEFEQNVLNSLKSQSGNECDSFEKESLALNQFFLNLYKRFFDSSSSKPSLINKSKEVSQYFDSEERKGLYSIKLVSSTQEELLKSLKNYFSQVRGSNIISGPYAKGDALKVDSINNLPISSDIIKSVIKEIITDCNDVHTKVIAYRIYENKGKSYKACANELRVVIEESNISATRYKTVFFNNVIDKLSERGIVEIIK
jgi:LPS O-antigen subunit length determinant protein (WzzB/FepE family)